MRTKVSSAGNPHGTFPGLGADRTDLVRRQFSIHLLGLSLLLLLPTVRGGDNPGDAPVLISSADEESAQQPETLDPIPPSDPGAIDDVQLPELKLDPIPRLAAEGAEKDKYYDDSSKFVPRAAYRATPSSWAATAWQFGHGPELGGVEGPGPGIGPFTGTPGDGGDGPAGDLRGRGHIRKGTGIIAKVQPAVNAALVWLAKHQLYEGNWSLQHYVTAAPTGPAPARATSPPTPARRRWACCPSSPPPKRTGRRARTRNTFAKASSGSSATSSPTATWPRAAADDVFARLGHDRPSGGLRHDRRPGRRCAAQAAVNFILNAQNTADGGWRYNPGDPGDTSVVGWQLMALKSATWPD